ncbi:hypothetical protein BHE74_00026655 [Ensete ventricosum]|nr:hypothetical protein BHE74_00026655 [Ensete ventricosum]RZR95080.1 hypothetical protein BHM03_00023880 [Ensete ventricosum]
MRLPTSTSRGEERKMGASTWLGGSNRMQLQDDGGGSWAALEMKGGRWAVAFVCTVGKQQGPASNGVRRGRGSRGVAIKGWPMIATMVTLPAEEEKKVVVAIWEGMKRASRCEKHRKRAAMASERSSGRGGSATVDGVRQQGEGVEEIGEGVTMKQRR